MSNWAGKRGEGYVILQFVLFGVIFVAPFLTQSWSDWPWPWNVAAWVLGIMLMGCGLLLTLAGVVSLGRNLTAVPYPKDDATLVESGAYRLVRHPIYSGIILGAFGWGLLHSSAITLLLALVLFLFFDIKSRREELWLADKFANYGDYQKRVRKLVPFVY